VLLSLLAKYDLSINILYKESNILDGAGPTDFASPQFSTVKE
jgi:hypothetical protein